jgi:alanyl-tRNA synthetase
VSDGAAAPTERLYYTDSYLAEFSARVTDLSDDRRRLYLDRTAFYPTSGGQLHDLGTVNGVPVTDVVDEGDRIAHLLAAPLTAGEAVAGAVDWARRFDHMQQHTGQHLLSAVFEDLFAARTLSVHFGDRHSTLDLEIDSLSPEKIEKAERQTNAIIAENRAVTVQFEDAASARGLRKAVEREGPLRIVGIDRLDRSACGGTHVRATGEVGCALLRGTERIRKTMRVEFLCGLRAVRRARADYLALASIAASLSASMDDAASLVGSQAAQLKESEQARRKLERELAGFQARALHEKAPLLPSGVRILSGDRAGTMDQLRVTAQALLDLPRCVYVGTTEKGDQLLVGATEDSGFDAGKLIRDALASVGGKGGGSPRLAQGSAPTPALAADAAALIRDALARGQ